MSRQEIYQRYATKTLLVKIKEDKEKYFKKVNYIPPFCALSFIIKEQNKEEILARYTYAWEKEVSKNEINEFIKKFLEDPLFRNDNAILESGTLNNEKFNFSNSDGVNLQCRQQIASLNKKKDFKDSDFELLRTYGIDKYSKMDLDTIEELIEPEIMIYIKSHFSHSSKVVKVCRWYLRGLCLELAIKKVLTDENIKNIKRPPSE